MKVHTVMEDLPAAVAAKTLTREADKLETAVKSSKNARPSERAMALVDVEHMRVAAAALRQAIKRGLRREDERYERVTRARTKA